MFRHTHHLANAAPQAYQAVDLHEGDWGNVGAVINCNYTHEGQEEVVKVVVENIDEEKRLVTFKAIEGHVIEQYKVFKATVHIENEGENNLVLWAVEYEKKTEDVPEPFSYLQFFVNLTKDVDGHNVNQ